jgi:7,8-dihydropterin-6-yl-methyl-4-(beta-D-ribofuranosyl)aminobenzene 5'-phosphate synthase
VWEHDQQTITNLRNLGSTRRFEFLPLVDWFTDNDSLRGEPGVAYLIRTDNATILFDLGLNLHNADPSPLLENMERLGINIDEIDIIVISHKHDDHVGGRKWSEQNSFSFTNYQLELRPVPVYTPVEMTYPGLTPVFSQKPMEIAEGVATLGVINNPSFFIDMAEQALAIKVKDKGIVIISGCGHQSLIKLIDRTNILFDDPIYAVLGGFHYPVEEGRNIHSYYKYFVADKLPWEEFTIEDVYNNIDLLKSKNVQLVGLSGHDSCDKSLEAFKEAFGDAYRDIKVGQQIIIEN